MAESPIRLNAFSSKARTGELSLLHGKVQTPLFLPVGSQATVRSLTPHDLKDIGIEMILCNAYHLYLRPGVETIKKAGGLHRFMGWDGPILTDSGGYQIFSLSSFRQITDEGVTFRSHIDGSEHHITPEYAVELQEKLGADIIMALDVCPESHAKKDYIRRAVEITTRWAKRCKKAQGAGGQRLFGIIQGGLDAAMRKISAEQLGEMDFPGLAIGGLSLGESKTEMWDIVDVTLECLAEDKPCYLMGVGSPEDILEGVSRGIDIFDSALPTRVARNGALYTKTGRKNIKRAYYKDKMEPLDAGCGCYTCRNFTAAYLHHLFRSEELLAYRLATIHNLYFMYTLMQSVHAAIVEDKFETFKRKFLNGYKTTDEERRIEQKARNLKAKRDMDRQDFQ